MLRLLKRFTTRYQDRISREYGHWWYPNLKSTRFIVPAFFNKTTRHNSFCWQKAAINFI